MSNQSETAPPNRCCVTVATNNFQLLLVV